MAKPMDPARVALLTAEIVEKHEDRGTVSAAQSLHAYPCLTNVRCVAWYAQGVMNKHARANGDDVEYEVIVRTRPRERGPFGDWDEFKAQPERKRMIAELAGAFGIGLLGVAAALKGADGVKDLLGGDDG